MNTWPDLEGSRPGIRMAQISRSFLGSSVSSAVKSHGPGITTLRKVSVPSKYTSHIDIRAVARTVDQFPDMCADCSSTADRTLAFFSKDKAN